MTSVPADAVGPARVPVSAVTTAMGGCLGVHLDAVAADRGRALRDARRALARIGRWADRLSRHLETSELSRLNADPLPDVRVGPTLGAVLRAARDEREGTGGLVDITLLDARLAAEGILPAPRTSVAGREWSAWAGPRRSVLVHRPPGLRFDLGGIAKGWLADRALDLLSAWSGAVVDADGDLAVRCGPGGAWVVAVDDPRGTDATLAVLRLSAPAHGRAARWGVATSGTSVHRWHRGDGVRHHLIDPRTRAPAVTDIVQATVVCGSALHAEAMAKAAVIAGSLDGLTLLDRAGVQGAVVLTDRGEVLALPSTLALLAA